MKVFISQSQPRSLALAQAIEAFIRKVVPGTEPWVSDTGIEKGTRFMSVIRENLNQAAAGIVCLTPENRTEPWILYEAGALSTKVTDRVWTVLLGLTHTDVPDPLKALNHTSVTEKADVLKLVRSIHKTVVAASEKTCSEADLETYFNVFWEKELEPKVTEIRNQVAAARQQPDPQSETLSLVQEIAARVADDRWKQEKALAMLHVIFATTVGSAAPPLEGLNQIVGDLQANAALRSFQRGAKEFWRRQYGGTSFKVEPLLPPDPPAPAAPGEGETPEGR